VRTLVGFVAAALALCGLAAPAGAAEGLRLTKVGEAGFPDRAFILSAPAGTTFKPGDVQLRENGRRVTNAEVLPPEAAGANELGVVLVIDASRSMRGEPIRGAMAAARAFARRRNPEHPLAVVTFNKRTRVLLPFTTDSAAIERALASPPRLSARGTHVYDGTVAAMRLLDEAGISAGSVVVLSDGADTGSQSTARDAVTATRESGARLFTVGLQSRQYDGRALERLASDAGGRAATATSPAELARIYEALGSQLANEYLIRYRSYATPGGRVFVDARVTGVSGSASAQYVAPHGAGAPSPFERPAAQTFWTSVVPLILVSLLCAVPLALLVLVVLGPARRPLADRLLGFVSVPEPEDHRSRSLTGQVLEGAERGLEGSRRWAKFKEELEIAQIKMPAIQVVGWTGVGTVVVGWVLASGAGTAFGVLALTVPLGVRAVIVQRLARQRKLFAEQLAENVQVIASALRAGHTLVGALSAVVEEAAEPSRREFRRVVADEQLGVPIEETLEVVSGRMESRDLGQVAIVATLQRETGGNTAEVLDRVAETIRGRFELRRMVDTLTAQGRLTRWILSFLPVALLVFFTVSQPEYVRPLYVTSEGNALLVVAAGLIVAGSLVMKKIMDIKV
jgi:tight adherence protein B